MTLTNADLDHLVLALTAAAKEARALRQKKPAERTRADLALIARLLQPALRGLDQLGTAGTPAGPVPEKTHRRVRK